MRRFVLTLGALITVAAGLPAAAAASAQSSLSNALTQGMQNAGGAGGAYVVDLNTGKPLFSWVAGTGRLPASVEKLYTTSTALLRFGPNATLTTRVLAAGSIDAHHGFHGILWLKGGGDPTFGSAGFDRSFYGTGATIGQLADNLIRDTGIRSIRGRIVGDDTYFDALRGTPATGYGPDITDVEGLLSALAYDRGFATSDGTVGQPRPALYATQQFVGALRARGVTIPSSTAVYTGRAPQHATQLAALRSPRMATLIQLTNTPSDNYFAEMLLKGLGAKFGGKTGTLQDSMNGTIAQGNCHGKTGTLHDVANLVGYCHARDGHSLAFAFLINSISSPDYVHSVEANQMAVALASYNG